MTLNLVKGEFSTLEDALRKQVQVLEAEVAMLQEHGKKMLLMVAKRDTKIEDLEILVEGHRGSIREYKEEVEKLQADKELRRGIMQGQSEVIDDLRSQLETPINFDDDE